MYNLQLYSALTSEEKLHCCGKKGAHHRWQGHKTPLGPDLDEELDIIAQVGLDIVADQAAIKPSLEQPLTFLHIHSPRPYVHSLGQRVWSCVVTD